MASLLLASCGSQVDLDRIAAAAGGTAIADGGIASGPVGGATTGPGASSAPGGAAGTVTADGGGPAAGAGADQAGAAAASDGGVPAPGAGGGPASGSPVVIGNIGSYSGVLGSIFPGGAAGVQAWAQDVNARGGVNGHPVKIVSGDDGGDPARALSLARQMVEEQGAIAFVGNMMPLSLSGIRPYLEDNGIPLVGGDMTLPDWSESPVIFPSGTDVTSISAGSIRLLAKAGGTKLAILWCGESPSCGALARAAEADPPPSMTVKFSAQISIVQTDFTTECLRAKQAGVDTIFVAADANTVIRVARSCKQQGITPLYGTASIAVGYQLASDPNLEGLIAPVNNAPWFDSSTPGGQRYVNAMRSYAPGVNADSPTASQFAGGLLVEAAAGTLGESPTAAQVLEGLRGLRGDTAQGLAPPLTFRNGPTGPVSCYFVVRVQGGQWVAPNGANPECL
jgi:branched-chain amino acid transport system substrate-binding protein